MRSKLEKRLSAATRLLEAARDDLCPTVPCGCGCGEMIRSDDIAEQYEQIGVILEAALEMLWLRSFRNAIRKLED